MKEDFWFYLVVDIILLVVIIRTAIRYKKYHVNYYLVPLIIYITGFVGVILAYLSPGGWLHVGRTGEILIFIAFMLY